MTTLEKIRMEQLAYEIGRAFTLKKTEAEQTAISVEAIKTANHIPGGPLALAQWAILSWQVGHNPMPYLRECVDGSLPDWRSVQMACDFIAMSAES